MELKYKIVILSGEPSGDFLGTQLMRALKRKMPVPVVFKGVGGEGMQAEGLETLFPLSDITFMGLFEVLPHLFQILSRIRQTVRFIEDWKPDLILTIDAPDFSNRVAKKVRSLGIPMIHLVAPSVWAWRPGRAKKIARLYDHLLTLLPFEPPYFEKVGLPSTFIGHPILESGADRGNGVTFRQTHGIHPDAPILMALPGSRKGEVTRHMPLFKGVIENLLSRYPNLRVVVPTVPSVAGAVRAFPWPQGTLIIEGSKEKYDAMAASNVALAASGTVSLELSMAKVPMVIMYKVSAITAFLVRHFLKIPYCTLVNILLNKPIIPEFVQYFTLDQVTASLASLLDPIKAQDQVTSCQEALTLLQVNDHLPSERAAEVIMTVMNRPEGQSYPPA